MMKKLLIVLAIALVICGSFWGYLICNYNVPIFMYHSLDKSRIDIYSVVERDMFYRQMEFLNRGRYNVISLDEYCKFLSEDKRIPRNTVVITFDDGYKDNLEAIDILREFNYPATIFLVLDKIGNEGYLSEEDIKSFLENTKVNIGSHTATHVYLPTADAAELSTEIFGSKENLENIFAESINAISYPIGGFTKDIIDLVKDAGYLYGCATNRGFSRELNLFALRRIKISNRDKGIRFWAKASGFYNIFKKPKNPH